MLHPHEGHQHHCARRLVACVTRYSRAVRYALFTRVNNGVKNTPRPALPARRRAGKLIRPQPLSPQWLRTPVKPRRCRCCTPK